MSRTIHVATLQMDAEPASLSIRLQRAETLVSEAAQAGADLIVLPELFNIGYGYRDENFEAAELIDGKTRQWMETTAARFNVHLAGTLLLCEKGDIYNTMLLFSPQGQMWRYQKNYPWAWERGYFREHRGITIAQTKLGDFGLMICWDIGHRHLWKNYASKVDMILIASCPPDVPNSSYVLPNGESFDFGEVGDLMESLKESGAQFFGGMLDQQAKWLGVPAVNSGASGSVKTRIPKAGALLRVFALTTRIRKLLPYAEELQMTCGCIPSCRIVNASGQTLAARIPAEGEGYIMAQVTLNEKKVTPDERQPAAPMGFIQSQLSYLSADVLLPSLMKSVYKAGLKRINK